MSRHDNRNGKGGGRRGEGFFDEISKAGHSILGALKFSLQLLKWIFVLLIGLFPVKLILQWVPGPVASRLWPGTQIEEVGKTITYGAQVVEETVYGPVWHMLVSFKDTVWTAIVTGDITALTGTWLSIAQNFAQNIFPALISIALTPIFWIGIPLLIFVVTWFREGIETAFEDFKKKTVNIYVPILVVVLLLNFGTEWFSERGVSLGLGLVAPVFVVAAIAFYLYINRDGLVLFLGKFVATILVILSGFVVYGVNWATANGTEYITSAAVAGNPLSSLWAFASNLVAIGARNANVFPEGWRLSLYLVWGGLFFIPALLGMIPKKSSKGNASGGGILSGGLK
ncbi:hypothetical protein KAZ57_00705 [Patescibacteria group bacterium]|nr:hypothetical protein [Patescibacteria group bacterium]